MLSRLLPALTRNRGICRRLSSAPPRSVPVPRTSTETCEAIVTIEKDGSPVSQGVFRCEVDAHELDIPVLDFDGGSRA